MIDRFEKVLYTPEDNAKDLLDYLPVHATKSIDVEIYGFTDSAFVDNIIIASQRGVKVRIMNDRTQSMGKSDRLQLNRLYQLACANPNCDIQIKIVESTHGAIDHLKQTIIDGVEGAMSDSCSVTYGSYNYSDSAQKQDNILVWTNDPSKCDHAMKKFELDWVNNKQNPEWQLTQVPVH